MRTNMEKQMFQYPTLDNYNDKLLKEYHQYELLR